MRQNVPLDLATMSHKQMGCELINATQIPSDSGNATVQMSAYPDLQKKIELDYTIIAAYECFRYLIVFTIDNNSGIGWTMHCNAYDHSGTLIKADIVPESGWNYIRPNALEFIGSMGYKSAKSHYLNGNYIRNLTYSQMIQLGTNNGLPAGHWEHYTYILDEPNSTNTVTDTGHKSTAPSGSFVEVSSDGVYQNSITCGCSCCFLTQTLYTVNFANCSIVPEEDKSQNNLIIINRSYDVLIVDADNLNRIFYTYVIVIDGTDYPFELLENNESFGSGGGEYDLFYDAYGNAMLWDISAQRYIYIKFLGEAPKAIKMIVPFDKTVDEYNTERGGGIMGGIRRIAGVIKAEYEYNIARQKWLDSQASGVVQSVLPYRIATNGYFQLYVPNEEFIISIETFFSMLVCVSTKKVLWYSNVGTIKIEGLNYAETEYLNSTPLAVWRVANRFIVVTDRVVQFWDWTDNFEMPISPQMQSGTYSYRVEPESICRYQDALYFLASAIETPAMSLYSLDKTGQFTRLSNPVLDAFVNAHLPTNFNSLFLFAAVSQFYSIDLIQWRINDIVIVFNPAFKTFFQTDFIFIYAGNVWLKRDFKDVGTLDNYINNSKVKTYNTNFEGALKAIRAIYLDHDCFADLQTLLFTIDRVAGQNITTTREARIMQFENRRNLRTRINGLGSGTDIAISVEWTGFNKINNFVLEVE